ncbi:MAG: methyltransferase domain-containing protein [Acidobacteriia bacterium]|nr:methyltransferase domain-containing protein [Terriglobia bacterium]
MKRKLLTYLTCPRCRLPFTLTVERAECEEILEGELDCASCSARFPILRGIPRFLPPDLSAEKQATAAAFGYEWTHYSEITEADQEEFLDWIRPLTAADFAGKVVLDGGCGKGRHIFQVARFGAADVIGIDLSDAVEAAYPNTRHLPNAHVIQADIYNLPFLAPFDLAYSIGVIHHLPDPKQGFLSLVKHVKPGGRASLWVYGKEGNAWIENLVDPVRIHVTSRLPKFLTQVISFFVSLPLYAALKLLYGPAERRPGLAWLKRRLPYSGYLCAISGYSFAENMWNVFDQLVAPTANYISEAEMKDWMATAKLGEVRISQRNNNSWRGTGVKPREA